LKNKLDYFWRTKVKGQRYLIGVDWGKSGDLGCRTEGYSHKDGTIEIVNVDYYSSASSKGKEKIDLDEEKLF